MDKKILVMFAFAILLLRIGFVSAALSCNDSDGGSDIFNPGYIINNSERNDDFCYDGHNVVEYLCGSDDQGRGEIENCPFTCINGACASREGFNRSFIVLGSGDSVNIGGDRIAILGIDSTGVRVSITSSTAADILDDMEEKEIVFYSPYLNVQVWEFMYSFKSPESSKVNLIVYTKEKPKTSICIDSDGDDASEYKEGSILVNDSLQYKDKCVTMESGNTIQVFNKEVTFDWLNFSKGDYILEYLCANGGVADYEIDLCINGCSNGACIRYASVSSPVNNDSLTLLVVQNTSVQINNTSITPPVSSENNISINNFTICDTIGLRKNGKYCSSDGQWLEEKDTSNSCENNFECSSNVCVSGNCISEGFIQKILNWFKNLFGSE